MQNIWDSVSTAFVYIITLYILQIKQVPIASKIHRGQEETPHRDDKQHTGSVFRGSWAGGGAVSCPAAELYCVPTCTACAEAAKCPSLTPAR